MKKYLFRVILSAAKNLALMGLVVGFFACGDDSNSTSAPGENGSSHMSSSTPIEDLDESSSSINDNSSSSSVIPSDSEDSNSSSSAKGDGKSSSSINKEVSSSSTKVNVYSSSSDVIVEIGNSSSSYGSSSSVKEGSSSSVFDITAPCTNGSYKRYQGVVYECVNETWILYVAPSSSSVASSSSVVSSSSAKSGSSSIKDGSEYDASANTLTDLRDGQVYKTVTIGTQTWMAENLNYAYKDVKFDYYDFDDHNEYTSDSTSWCYYDEVSNCEKYGRLYTWSAVMDSAAQFSINAGTKCGYNRNCTPNSPHRGICPEGWHVPDDTEWNTLWTAVGGTGAAGSKLKSTSGWYSGNSTNSYGFTVLPVGYHTYKGYFKSMGYYAHFWSSSVYDSFHAHYWVFSYSHGRVDHGNYPKNHAFSVRCIKD